ncbi:MAG: hypothetical protein EXS01_06985 [Phycisphaerales bacterium]|nr:hypothetical protein [Phycisphaerales bacterium]
MITSNRLTSHFAVAAAAISCAGVAHGTVIYSGVVNITVQANIDGCYMNVETGQYVNGPGSGVPGWDVNPYGTSITAISLFAATGTGYMRNPGAGTSTARTRLDPGTVIGSAAFFYGSSSATIGTSVGQWAANSSGYYGFKFLTADATTHYGWMQLAIGANALTRVIVDYAWENVAGGSITVVPGPGAIALLGFAGIFGRRRRA